ncbi:MAG: hypothetical protein ACRC4W_09155 [Treponemataceae bacterium]
MRDQNPSREPQRFKKKQGSKNNTHHKRAAPEPVIRRINYPKVVCAKCGEIIQDITSALTDKQTGGPAHFDCILRFLQGAEQLAANEKITYIGQGRFGVIHFENIHDLRRFTIKRVIEWEERDKKPEWRQTISAMTIGNKKLSANS